MPLRVRVQPARHGGLHRAVELHRASVPDIRRPGGGPCVEGEADPGPGASRGRKDCRFRVQDNQNGSGESFCRSILISIFVWQNFTKFGCEIAPLAQKMKVLRKN